MADDDTKAGNMEGDTLLSGDALDPEANRDATEGDARTGASPSDTDTAPRTRSKGPRSRADREADREAERLERDEQNGESGEEKRKRGRPPGSTKRPVSIEKRLAESINAIAFVAGFFNQADGEVISANAVDLAHALDVLALENPPVHRALVAMMSGSAWAGVGMAAFPIVAGIAANHNVGPFGGKSNGNARTESHPSGGQSAPPPGSTPSGDTLPSPTDLLRGQLVVVDGAAT